MAIKTFTTGEVLTAADTNTYLANSGLVFVKSQTVGSAVSSVTMTGAFDSTYDNYKIIYDGGTASSNVALAIQLGSTITGYHYSIVYSQYNATTPLGAGATNTTAFLNAGRASTNRNNLNIELFAPNVASYSGARYASTDYLSTNGFMITGAGMLNDTTSYTAFTILPASGTLTGGTITCYGYRKG